MKKHLALLLAAALLIGLLAGCGGRDTALVGTWQAPLEMADMVNEEFAAEGLGDYLTVSSFALLMNITFTRDGTYTVSVDKAAFERTTQTLKEEIKSGFLAYAEDMIAQAGLSMTADELFSAMGTSLDELIEESFNTEDLMALMDEAAAEGNYEAKGGKLFLSDGLDYRVDPDLYTVYTLQGDKLTFLEDVGDDGDHAMAQFYPLEFTRLS